MWLLDYEIIGQQRAIVKEKERELIQAEYVSH